LETPRKCEWMAVRPQHILGLSIGYHGRQRWLAYRLRPALQRYKHSVRQNPRPTGSFVGFVAREILSDRSTFDAGFDVGCPAIIPVIDHQSTNICPRRCRTRCGKWADLIRWRASAKTRTVRSSRVSEWRSLGMWSNIEGSTTHSGPTLGMTADVCLLIS
jgi:hypothetical protein